MARFSVVSGSTPETLASIREPAVELAVWNRTLPSSLGRWTADCPPRDLPEGRMLVRRTDLDAGIAALIGTGRAPAVEAAALATDVLTLTMLFADITGAPAVDIKLERIRNDACWKFHRDCVVARLLTTYRGPATEWVHPEDSDAALREQTDYAGRLERLSCHAVALFKGSCAHPASGIVHRSPPIRGSGVTRLLLCLNLETDASPDLWRE